MKVYGIKMGRGTAPQESSIRFSPSSFDTRLRKNVKMSQDEVEKLKQAHEDAAIRKLRDALPTIHVKDLRRTLKEYDGNAE